MHSFELGRVLILVTVANGAPVIASKALGEFASQPIDFGMFMFDGRPLLGPSKTFRGVLCSLGATAIAAAILNLGWEIGIAVACAAMAGDLLSSFLKRRFGLPASVRATGLDQIPESLLPCIVSANRLGLGILDILMVTSTFFVGEIVLSLILYRLHLRRRPY